MRYVTLAFCLGTFLFLAPVTAEASRDGGMKNPCGNKHAMNPCMKKKKMAHHKERRQMMNDQMDILLQTIKLLKAEAKDSANREKAGKLEKRMQKLVESHDKMHERMEKRMKERYKQHNPCGTKGYKGHDGSHEEHHQEQHGN